MKTIEQYEEEFSRTQNNCTCEKCGSSFIFTPDEVFWDEKGFGYSTKLTRCKHCDCINIIKHVEDYGFSKTNTDRRLYFK